MTYNFNPYQIQPFSALSYAGEINGKPAFLATLVNADGSRSDVYGIIYGGACIIAPNGTTASKAISDFLKS